MHLDPSRLGAAAALAARAHASPTRAGTSTPDMAHALAVASLAIEDSGSENQVLAALLHDTIEVGGVAFSVEIQSGFGHTVLGLVEACSDSTTEGKAAAAIPEAKRPDWRRRKLDFLARLEQEDEGILLVAACAMLHRVRAIVTDLERFGPAVFDRIGAGREGTLWYYGEAERALRARGCPVAPAMAKAVARLQELAVSADSIEEAVSALAAELPARQRRKLLHLLEVWSADAQRSVRLGSQTIAAVSQQQQQVIAARLQLPS